eukprot:8541418-Alexandrium_andersonii.AAC.1
MFDNGPSNFPKLAGNGAELRCLTKPLEQVFLAFMDHSSQVHRHIRLSLKFSAALEDLMDEHADGFVWPAAASIAFQSAVFKFLALQTALGGHFHPRGIFVSLHHPVPLLNSCGALDFMAEPQNCMELFGWRFHAQ